MLTADLVRAFRRQGKLKLRAWKPDQRARALVLATGYTVIAADLVGGTREELMEAIADIPVGARERKLADGLRKLVLDRCSFESDTALSPSELREEVFAEAARLRQAGAFERGSLIAIVAERHALSTEEIERLLYADLKSAQRLLAYDEIEGPALVAHYDKSQVQAVLLKAESLIAHVVCADAATYRVLFRKLKFQRLLHTIEKEGDGYLITITGPVSLFRAGTKYGLQLALCLPALQACDRWSIDAIVRWGKDRSPLSFHAEGKGVAEAGTPELPAEVRTLLDKQKKRTKTGKSEWTAKRCSRILSIPGLGECIPDLVFEKQGKRVYLEVLGFWSRAAVWKRVELAQAGLNESIVFAVPSRLRVSEEVLPDDLPAALYVYKGVMSPKALEACFETVIRP